MIFASRSKSRSGARRRLQPAAAEVEICESRLLLTTPDILTPSSTITTSADGTVDFSWNAVDEAASYELWISSLERFEQIYYQDGIAGTSISIPVEDLHLGKIRIWARATLSDSTQSAWSPGADVTVVSAPVVDGPAAGVPGNITSDNTPEITWKSANGAEFFQIWVTDLEAQGRAQDLATATNTDIDVSSYATVYDIDNRLRDDNGDLVLGTNGLPILQEIRSFTIPERQGDEDSPERELSLGRYRVWVRAFDEGRPPGTTPAWSPGYTFQVSTPPELNSPEGPTFQTSPLLTWDPVVGATHYEIYVSETGTTAPLFRRTVEANGDVTPQTTQIVISQNGLPIVDNNDGVTTAGERPRLDQFGNPVLFTIPHHIQQNQFGENVITVPDGQETSYTFWVRAIRRGTDIPTVIGNWSTPSTFSTLEAPTITGPVGVAHDGETIVTAARPTIEWTGIDGAATYEILVQQFNNLPPFLRTRNNTTSYTFENDIPAGTFTVWVRGIDTRGRYSEWSQPFQMVTSGGAPVVLTPADGATGVTFATFSWLPVDDAVSYQLWVSEVGVDFTAIVETGITTTSFTHPDPLNNSSYRVWVRALRTDGTYGAWSSPITFQGGVVSLDVDSKLEDSLLLTSLSIQESDDTATPETVIVPAESPQASVEAETSEDVDAGDVAAIDLLAAAMDGAWWEDTDAA